MILLDANVVIDLAEANSPFRPWAKGVLKRDDAIAVNVVALVEASVIWDLADLLQDLQGLGVQILDVPAAAAGPCLRAWREYLPRRKANTAAPRVPLPDFFIGAHAEASRATLATRDAGRYETYFPGVELLTPEPRTPARAARRR